MKRSATNDRQDVVLGIRIGKGLQAKIVAEQQRLAKLTGIEPSLNEVVRMLIEKGLGAKGKKR